MEISLNFKPFKSFWINCAFNTLVSILASLEPSYSTAALLNDYSYLVIKSQTPNMTNYDALKVEPMVKYGKTYINMLFTEKKPLDFKYGDNYFDTLRELVKEKKLIYVGVDLFYWIPNSICWKKHHWEHYSFINGVNDEKRTLYVFDDNLDGYNEFIIPEDRLIDAISNFSGKPHAFIYKTSKKIKRFRLKIDDVKENALRIIDDINKIMPADLWYLQEKDFTEGHMCDLIASQIYQIINRHIANQYLMRELKDVIRNPKIINDLSEKCIELQKGWAIVKNNFVKIYFSKYNKSSVDDINKKSKLLFLKEIDMWNMLLEYAN